MSRVRLPYALRRLHSPGCSGSVCGELPRFSRFGRIRTEYRGHTSSGSSPVRIWKLTPNRARRPDMEELEPEPIIVRAESGTEAWQWAELKTAEYLPAVPQGCPGKLGISQSELVLNIGRRLRGWWRLV